MGIISDLLSQLNYSIAMEADAEDITGEVKNSSSSVTGAKDANNGEIDTDTSDILGTKDDSNEDNNTTTKNDDNITDDDKEKPDNTDKTDDLSEDEEDEDDFNDVSDDESSDNNFETNKKIQLHENMLHFYDILVSDISLLTTFASIHAESDSMRVLSLVRENIEQCKTIVLDILTDDFGRESYSILLRKYVALNRVYDICIEMLSKHYTNKENNELKNKK